MMKKFTLKKMFLKKENWLFMAMFALLLVFGCYEFTTINQPTEGYTNSSFDVQLVMKEDADDTNDWTDESGTLNHPGLFGVLLPEGWTVTDNIAVRVESADSLPDGFGGWVYPSTSHSGDYVLAYNEAQSAMLADSTGAPAGYYWWGARTTENVDMSFFDSLYFTVTILTDDKTGEFYLQYAVGDVEYWEREPYHFKSEPLPITITYAVGINPFLNEASVSVYPNPSYGFLNIELAKYDGEIVEMMIYDLRGRQIMAGQITNAQTTIDLVDIHPGMYVIRLEAGDEIITKKFVRR